MNCNKRFLLFHGTLVDIFRLSFPERRVRMRMRKSNADDGSFNDKHRPKRKQLLLVRDMYSKYRSESVRLLKGNLTKCYRTAIGNSKTEYFSNIIENSANKSKTEWNLVINHLKNGTIYETEEFNLEPEIFNDNLSTIAEKL